MNGICIFKVDFFLYKTTLRMPQNIGLSSRSKSKRISKTSDMKSICLSCLIYTLKDQPVKDNAYLDVFYVWLTKVIRFGGLTETDSLQINIDARTLDYLQETESVLPVLVDKIPCPYKFIRFDPPSTHLEGMMKKYTLTEYSADVYLYTDIDIMVVNPLSNFTEQTKDGMLYLCSEGELLHSNYSAGFPEEFEKAGLPGLSAGKFAFTSKMLRDSFFNCINSTCDYSSKHYTVEQPFFNIIAHLMPPDLWDFDFMFDYVSFNGDKFDPANTVFYDNAGCVANGFEKLRKTVSVLCSIAMRRH